METDLDDFPGLGWSCVVVELLQPQKIVPGRKLKSHDFAMLDYVKLVSKEIDEPLMSTAAQAIMIFLDQVLRQKNLLFPVRPKAFNLFKEEDLVSEVRIDAFLAKVLIELYNNDLETGGHVEVLKQLQLLTEISLVSPHPTLRYNAHVAAAMMFQKIPSAEVKVGILRHILQNSPFVQVKASAIEWLKQEIAAAPASDDRSDPNKSWVFSSPLMLRKLGPYVFPDLRSAAVDLEERWDAFRLASPLYLATLKSVLVHDQWAGKGERSWDR